MPTLTTNRLLQKPALASRNWDAPVNANSDVVDAILGPLAVTIFEAPSASASRKVIVAAGSYVKSNGTIATYAGTGSGGVTLTASSTLTLYIKESDGSLVTTDTSYPSSNGVRLATVTTDGSTITGITDDRIVWQSAGAAGSFVPTSGNTSGSPMTGLLYLSGDPTGTNGAATKHYVDTQVSLANPMVIGGTIGSSPTTGSILTVGTSGILSQFNVSSPTVGLLKISASGVSLASAGSDYITSASTFPASNLVGTISAGNLPSVGTISPGSYTLTSITVDGTGRITGISNGSAGSGTLAIGSAIGGSPTDGNYLVVGTGSDSGKLMQVPLGAGTTQSANTVWAGPATGSAAVPVFRALVASDVPVMVASGSSHATGAVPDPGSSPGSAKYLREDATWVNPWTSPTFTGTVTEPVPVWPSQTANRTWSSPDGSSGAPTFRALAAGDLPALVASGSSHAAGIAPDPGATAGTVKFLREDATWSSEFPHTSGVWTSVTQSGGTLTIDWSVSNRFYVTLTANVTTLTYSNPPSAQKFQAILIRITQGGSGSYTITWPSGTKWPGGTAATLSTTVGAVDLISVSSGPTTSVYDTMLVAGNLS